MTTFSLLLVLFALSACGGGGSDSATDPPHISKAALIKKGDAICAETDKLQRVRLNAYLKVHPTAEESETAFAEMLRIAGMPPIASEIEQLRALGVPKGDEAKVNAILTGYEKSLRAAEADPKSIFNVTGGPFAPFEKQAAKYGFKACAEPL